MQSTLREDRCVLLLGYEGHMKDMLDSSNPGLACRFPTGDAFYFEDFADDELRSLLDYKLNKQGLGATEKAKDVAIGVLCRDRPNCGNAGEVENVVSRAKAAYKSRTMENTVSMEVGNADVVFLPHDFDPDFDRTDLLSSLTLNLRARKQNPRDHVPFNYVFKRPPGTGKTTVAELYYELGILSTKESVECSTSDLTGQYVVQTLLNYRLLKANELCLLHELLAPSPEQQQALGPSLT
ncbi:uncharacterized protein HMPREF1541_04251 [Cyphellophora europaea CBS 101466]|uniref:Uncharacterized protein n=1 Tax=Cyphellophora europaea (strain CBS 101466) TaxID=1220924 RepID=W2RU00_CYPE1|nr:uncharacterized protein HMPREF1541_04251 [Cyphellophora europaea CBS 101466]ETN39976.1 hypothetical protein HMPREF1541_04251 [Cyphellophora europaea CBS 101466]